MFSPIEFITIHRRLFEGIYSHAGRIRDYNITKEEWVLDGDAVTYDNAINLKETLEYDFSVEKNFSYKQPPLLMQGFVNVVLGLIVENYRPESKKNKRNDLILDIVNYVELNYVENITLDKISAHFGYSKYYFSKLFNKLFGCTIKNYVNTVRCAIIDNNKGIGMSNAILNAGFNTLSSYYKFKKKRASH